MTPARIRPFPWRSLEATTHAEVSALRDVKRWAATHVRLDRLAQAMSELLDVEIGLYIPRARPLAMSAVIDRGVGVILARADLPDVARSALVEAEGTLAANLVARALRRPPPALVNTAVDPAPGIAGAFAAVIAAAARRSHTGIVLRVIGAGPAAALEADLNKIDPDLWAVSLTVLVGNESFAARIIVPRSAALGCPGPTWDATALAALGASPLAIPIVACGILATASDVATLRTGDALVLPGDRWLLSRGTGTTFSGPVLLAAPSSDLGLRATLGEDGRVVLRGKLEPLLAAEALMDSDDKDAVVAALGEVSVVVRIEIGEAVMAARDWASLGRGDVVGLGRRVGERVLLRVGGVPLARGELVDLDGEVAVRIVERISDESTTP